MDIRLDADYPANATATRGSEAVHGAGGEGAEQVAARETEEPGGDSEEGGVGVGADIAMEAIAMEAIAQWKLWAIGPYLAKKEEESKKQKAEEVLRKAAQGAKRKAVEDAVHFQIANKEARFAAKKAFDRVMYEYGYTNLLSTDGSEWVSTQSLYP